MEITDYRQMLEALKGQTLRESESPYSGWKIAPTETIINHKGQFVQQENPRSAVVADFIRENYRIEVTSRCRKPLPLDKDKYERIVKFVTTPNDKSGLILYGNVGTGKTTYMMAVGETIRQLYKQELQQGMITLRSKKASELGILMKDDRESYEKVKKACVLLLDDIGFAGDAEIVNNYGIKTDPIADVLEHRYANRLFTVMTTNLSEDELQVRYGQRIYSRLREMCVWVAFKGEDYRINKIK